MRCHSRSFSDACAYQLFALVAHYLLTIKKLKSQLSLIVFVPETLNLLVKVASKSEKNSKLSSNKGHVLKLNRVE